MAIVFFIAFVLSICALGWIGGIILAVISVGIADIICTTDSMMQLTSSIIMIGVLVALYIMGDKEQKRIDALPEEERAVIVKNNLERDLETVRNKIIKLLKKNEALHNRLEYISNYNPSYNISKSKEKADMAYTKQLRKYHEYHGGYGSKKSYDKFNKRYHRKEANYLLNLEYEGKKMRSYDTEAKNIIRQISDNEYRIKQLEIKRDEIIAKINNI